VTTSSSGKPDDFADLRRKVDELRREFGTFGARLSDIEEIVAHYFDAPVPAAPAHGLGDASHDTTHVDQSISTRIDIEPGELIFPTSAAAPAVESVKDGIAPVPHEEVLQPAAMSTEELPALAEPIAREYPTRETHSATGSPPLASHAIEQEPTLPDRVRDYISAKGDVLPDAIDELREKIAEKVNRPAVQSFAKNLSEKFAKPQTVDWEALIGGRWMTWVGAFTLLLAVGFGLHWAATTFSPPPWMHLLGIHLLGAGFLAGAVWTYRRGFTVTMQALVGLGIFTLYAAAFSAFRLYHLWSEQVAFIECAGVTVLAIGLALYADSVAVVLLGALGGYLTPILTSSGSGNYIALFIYLAFLNITLTSCAVWRDWRFLKPLTLAATAVMFAGWVINAKFDPMDNRMVWGTLWFGVLHASIFLLGTTIPPLLWKKVSNGADLLAQGANSLLFVTLAWFLFREHPDQQLALLSWGMSLLHAVLFGATYMRLSNSDRMPRVHLALASVFFTLAIPLQINNSAFWGATWCLEGLAITAVGVYFRDRQLCVTAMIALLLGAARLMGWDLLSAAVTVGDSAIDRRALMFAIAGVVMLVAGFLYRLIPWALDRKDFEEPLNQQAYKVCSALGSALIMLAPWLQLTERVYLGPAWSFEAIAFVLLGLLVQDRQFRLAGATAMLLAAARLVGWDFLSPAASFGTSAIDQRALAFSIAGLVMLVSGFFYRWFPSPQGGKAFDDPFDRRLSGLASAIGAGLIILAPMLQLGEKAYLGPAWSFEAVAFILLGLLMRDRQFHITGIIAMLLAAGRLVGWDFLSPAASVGTSAIDQRTLAFSIAGFVMLASGFLYRWFPSPQGGKAFDDPFNRQLSALASAIGAGLITLAPMLQLTEHIYLGPVWGVEAVAFIVLGLLLRDQQFSMTGMLVFAVAAGRLLGFDFLSSSRSLGSTAFDLRAASFLWVGLLAMACGVLFRIFSRSPSSTTPRDAIEFFTRDFSKLSGDDFAIMRPTLLTLLGTVLVTCSPPLQLSDWSLLGPVWAAEAVLFTILGLAFSDRLYALLGAVLFGVAGGRLIPWEFRAQSRLIEGTRWDLRFVVMEISGALAILAGSLYWLIPRLLRREKLSESERAVGWLLLAAGNLALMLGLLCQWDSRLVLALWTLNSAILWPAGFRFDLRGLRWYATALALVMVLGRAIYDGASLDSPYVFLANSRFASLALVSIVLFAAGGMYRKKFGKKMKLREQLSGLIDGKAGEFTEAVLDPLLGILANVVLLTAISFEIHSRYASAIAAGNSLFSDMHMAEMATYSIVWAIYAAIVVAAGFALRYPLFRLMGLIAFGPILLKVFFLDLENLRWLPRVLALAVLGIMLMGVSMLYQKFAARMKEADAVS
jgi:uncharacterized membrane protein